MHDGGNERLVNGAVMDGNGLGGDDGDNDNGEDDSEGDSKKKEKQSLIKVTVYSLRSIKYLEKKM